ncbi:hypothetical protein llap_6877 [Limosa lapponica baueri]|uniref:Uncharacterized protein n=1 Tax=Limosa lapponica baueri TaxID=1758121 RepID=A0A2I0U9S5_LIMLA|nr:hypothetical protein llap_6877 [Limosa lapponica baueri]
MPKGGWSYQHLQPMGTGLQHQWQEQQFGLQASSRADPPPATVLPVPNWPEPSEVAPDLLDGAAEANPYHRHWEGFQSRGQTSQELGSGALKQIAVMGPASDFLDQSFTEDVGISIQGSSYKKILKVGSGYSHKGGGRVLPIWCTNVILCQEHRGTVSLMGQGYLKDDSLRLRLMRFIKVDFSVTIRQLNARTDGQPMAASRNQPKTCRGSEEAEGRWAGNETETLQADSALRHGNWLKRMQRKLTDQQEKVEDINPPKLGLRDPAAPACKVLDSLLASGS